MLKSFSQLIFIMLLSPRENNVCDINPVHHLFATGTSEVSAKQKSESLVKFHGGLKPTVHFRMSLLIKKLSNK